MSDSGGHRGLKNQKYDSSELLDMTILYGTPDSWNIDLGRIVLGFPLLYLKGMRAMMFQLSGFYCTLYSKTPFD